LQGAFLLASNRLNRVGGEGLFNIMRPIFILCVLALLSVCSAEDLIFFADDHYKAVGAPKLEAFVANPVLEPDAVGPLTVTLVNSGRIDELIPTQANGSDEDIALEIGEEMRCIDAMNITATLLGQGPIRVISGPCAVGLLPSGAIARMEFNLSVGAAEGWYDLPLKLDYEHQVDVMVSNGSISPLYGPDSSLIDIGVFIPGTDAFSVEGVKSDLHRGGRGMILAAIKNQGHEICRGCTAHLITKAPFTSEGDAYLGDLAPGAVGTAEFAVDLDENATLGDNSLPCELNYLNGSSFLQIPVSPERASNHLIYIPAIIALLIAAGGAALAKRRGWPKRHRFSR
jgi:hypothetical protein